MTAPYERQPEYSPFHLDATDHNERMLALRFHALWDYLRQTIGDFVPNTGYHPKTHLIQSYEDARQLLGYTGDRE